MLLAIKIGNSTVSLVFFNDPFNDSSFEKLDFYSKEFDERELLKFLKSYQNFDCIICSVVPVLTEKIFNILNRFSKNIIIIDYQTPTGLILKLNNPETFGADRLTTAVAAFEFFKTDIAVVDLGTATTITIITKEGEILGGAIMPGINTMNQAVSEKTAKLPIVDLQKPVSALGKDTHSAIRSGIVLGTAYAVEGLIRAIQKEINRKLYVVLTGGYSEFLSKHIKIKHTLNTELVIEGMRLIYLKNTKIFQEVVL